MILYHIIIVIPANDELFGQESVPDHCELCGGLLCHNCKHCKQDCKHDGLLEESAAAMRPILDEAEYQLTGINDVIKALERQSDEISEQRISIRDRVEQHFKTLLESVNKQKDEVVSTLDQLVDEKLENLAGQRDEVEAHRSKIGQLSLSLSRKTLDGDVSQETTEIVMQMKEMIDSFTPAPCEKADLDFIPNAEFDNACPQMGRIIQKLPISKCYSTGKGLKTAYLGTTSSTLIHLVGVKPATPDPLIFSELISDSNALKLTPIVTKKSPNQYELMYTPTTRGLHKLHVQINGEHIRGSPFDVIVKVPVDQLGTPVRVIQGVNLPTGIAVNKQGEVIVAEEGAQCVSIYNQMGEKLRCFGAQGTGNGLLLHPRGIAVDAHNNILIVDRGKNCIAVFSSEGVFKTAVGKFGSNELEFNNPLGIAINRSTNKIYVSDLENHRIQILNPDLTFLSCFGSYGSGNGQFIKPRDIALDSIGNVYVVDSSNHRIQVLTEKGEYLRSFGRQGGGAGELSWPSSICIDSNDTVYVTEDDNHRVSIFTSEGTFLTSFGTYGKSPGQFNVPHGIAVDVCDNLFVSDHHNFRLQIF